MSGLHLEPTPEDESHLSDYPRLLNDLADVLDGKSVRLDRHAAAETLRGYAASVDAHVANLRGMQAAAAPASPTHRLPSAAWDCLNAWYRSHGGSCGCALCHQTNAILQPGAEPST